MGGQTEIEPGDPVFRKRKVYIDYFLGLHTREENADGAGHVWNFNAAGFADATWTGDGYMTNDKKEVISSIYPIIGPYDTADPDLQEYHVLLAKSAGIDGFFCEWQWTNMPQFLPDGTPDPTPPTTPNEQTQTTIQLAQLAASYGLKVGIHWSNGSLFAWYDFPDRSTYIEQAKWDLEYMLTNLYSVAPPVWAQRPIVMCFDLTAGNVPATALNVFYEPEIVDIKAHVAAHDPLLMGRPIFYEGHPTVPLGEIDPALLPEVDGFFGWHRFNNDPFDVWTNYTPATEQVQYLNDFHASARQHSVVPFFTSATPRFDNHKARSWGTGTQDYTPYGNGGTLADTLATWAQSHSHGALLTTWNDFAEATVVEPTREHGYDDLELCALAIAAFKFEPAPDLSLLRLPERLYRVRKRVDAATRAGLDPAAAPLADAVDSANLAASAIGTLDSLLAITHLADAESHLDTAWSSLTATTVDARWTAGAPADGLTPVGTPTIEQKGGQDGARVEGGTNLRFDITGSAATALASGLFEGTFTFEYFDEDAQGTSTDYHEFVRLHRQGDTPRTQLLARRRMTETWRTVRSDFHVVRNGDGTLPDPVIVVINGLGQTPAPTWVHHARLEGVLYKP